jgi:hypothetical protein
MSVAFFGLCRSPYKVSGIACLSLRVPASKARHEVAKRDVVGSLGDLVSQAWRTAAQSPFARVVRDQCDQKGGLHEALARMEEQLLRSERLYQLIRQDSKACRLGCSDRVKNNRGLANG